MATVKFQNQYGETDEVMNDTDSCNETVWGTDSCGETASRVTVSCGEANNNLSKKIPLLKEQQPTESDDPDSVSLSKIEKAIMSLSEKQRDSFGWFIKNDFEEKSAIELAKKYSPLEIEKARDYYNKQSQKNARKGKPIADKCGYFVRILQCRYWENSKL